MSTNNGIIERLKERERKTREALAKEIVKVKRREFKEFERLKNDVGGAYLAVAAEDAEVEAHIKSTLARAPILDARKKILRAKGWL